MNDTDKGLQQLAKVRRAQLDDGQVPAERLSAVLASFRSNAIDDGQPSVSPWARWLGGLEVILTDLFDVGMSGGVSVYRGEPSEPSPRQSYQARSRITLEISPRGTAPTIHPLPLLLLRSPGDEAFLPLWPAPTVQPGPVPGWLSVELEPARHFKGAGEYALAVVVIGASATPPPEEALPVEELDALAKPEGGRAWVRLIRFDFAPSDPTASP